MNDSSNQNQETFPKIPTRTYGLMELMRGRSPAVGKGPEDTVFSWPHLLMRQLIVFLVITAFFIIFSLLVFAPLEEPANPDHPTNPSKAPWYFLGLQELVSYSALLGGVVAPGVYIVYLILVPYLDRKKSGVGIWFAKERRVANTIFTVLALAWLILTLIGVFMRGPNWEFLFPWEWNYILPI